MEFAAVAVIVGCQVTMIFLKNHMMSLLFTSEIAEPYKTMYKAKGVTFVKDGALAKEFISDESQTTVAGCVWRTRAKKMSLWR